MGIKRQIGRLLQSVRAGENHLLSNAPEVTAAPAAIQIESSAFEDGQPIPTVYTALGDEVSPPISWRGVPPGTQEILLVVEDADPPLPRPIVHGIVYGIDPEQAGIEQDTVPGHHHTYRPTKEARFKVGKNTFRKAAWLGPDPVPGHGTHHYFFQLFALDTKLSFEAPPTKSEVLQAITRHVLARGRMVGTYAVEG